LLRKIAAFALLFALQGAPAFAWGTTGHLIINRAAMLALPASVPSFLRAQVAIDEVSALGPELDRSKGSGRPHDPDSDPGHYVDVDDGGTIAGAIPLGALPGSREAYDAALDSAGTDEYRQGFLPYSIIDGWQQVRKDLAYWRADNYLSVHAGARDRAWFARDRALREMLTLRDVGVWGHYVGDGSQPLHVTVHYNGWGRYPNPRHYTGRRGLHSLFEGAFTRDHARLSAVLHLVSRNAAPPGSPHGVIAQIQAYLRVTSAQTEPLYELEKSGGFRFATPQAVNFMQQQLARGASELRDLVVAAWTSSANAAVGYPEINVADILQGRILPSREAFGGD